jgi:hypothetical protein
MCTLNAKIIQTNITMTVKITYTINTFIGQANIARAVPTNKTFYADIVLTHAVNTVFAPHALNADIVRANAATCAVIINCALNTDIAIRADLIAATVTINPAFNADLVYADTDGTVPINRAFGRFNTLVGLFVTELTCFTGYRSGGTCSASASFSTITKFSIITVSIICAFNALIINADLIASAASVINAFNAGII